MKTKTLLLTLLLTLITATLLTTPQTTQAATHTQPPQLFWLSSELGDCVRSVAWSPSGDKIAVGVGKVIVFSSTGNKLWESDNLGGTVRSISWSPDGTKIAAGGWFTYVIVLSASDGKKLWERDLGDYVVGVSWSPDGTKIAAGVYYGEKVIVFSSTGNKLWESDDLGDYVVSVSWSPSGDKIAVGGDFGKVIVLSASDGKKLWERDLGENFVSIAWSPSGDKIAVGLFYGEKVIVLSASDGKKLWERDLGDRVLSVSWSPDGTKIAAGGWFWYVIVLSASDGKKLWGSIELGDYVLSVSWSPDGTKIATGLTNGHVVVLSFTGSKLWGSSELGAYVWSVSWSPSGDKIAVGGDFGKVIVFSSTGNKLWESDNLGGTVRSVSWSPDGTKIAAGGGNGKVIVLSASDGKKLWERDLGNMVLSVAWSPSGDKIAVGLFYGEKVIVLSASDGKKLWERDLGDRVLSVSWSPDGTKIAAGVYYGKKVIVFSSTGNKLWESDDLGDRVWSVAWSPSGDKIAASGGNRKVIVLSSTGNKLWESDDLGGTVKSVAWSPSGDKIATGLTNGHVVVLSSTGQKLWEITLIVLQKTEVSVAWSPSGDKIAAGLLAWRVIVFYVFGGSSLFRVSGSSMGLRVCFFDGSVTNCYSLNSSGLRLYADPGSYEVRYYLDSLPAGYMFVGDVDEYLRKNPLTKTITARAGIDYTLTPPTLEDFLGRFVLKGSSNVDLRVRFSWDSGSEVVSVPAGGSVEVYADPREWFNIEVLDVIGSLPGGYSVHVSAGDVKVINLAVAKLVLKNPLNVSADVVVKWDGGSKVFNLVPGGEVSIYAMAGDYEIKFSLNLNQFSHIGVIEPIVRKVRISGGRSYEFVVPGLDELFGIIEFKAPKSVHLTAHVSWASGSKKFDVPAGGSVKVYAAPGDYSVSFSVIDADFLGGLPERVIGLSSSVSVSVGVGEHKVVRVFDNVPIGGLKVSSDFDATLNISWGSGFLVEPIRGGESKLFLVRSGKYFVKLTPSNSILNNELIVGDKSRLICGKEVDIGEYEVEEITISMSSLVGTLKIVGPAEALVRVSWMGGSKSFTIPASGVLELKALPGTEYRVTVSALDVLHSDYTSVVRVSAGAVVPVYVSFSFSPVFYGLVLSVVGVFGASFYMFVVRPRVSVRLLTREVVEGITEFIEVEFRNSGLKRASFKASISVDGAEVFSGVVELPGRSRKVIKLPLRSRDNIADLGGVEG